MDINYHFLFSVLGVFTLALATVSLASKNLILFSGSDARLQVEYGSNICF